MQALKSEEFKLSKKILVPSLNMMMLEMLQGKVVEQVALAQNIILKIKSLQIKVQIQQCMILNMMTKEICLKQRPHMVLQSRMNTIQIII